MNNPPTLYKERKKLSPINLDDISGEIDLSECGLPAAEMTDPPSLNDILTSCRIKATDYYPVPPIAISFIHGETPATFGTLGNFSLVTGKAKSKKTFLMVMVVAACLKRTAFQNTIKSELAEEKGRIIVIDTEQSKYHVWKRLNAIAYLAGQVDLNVVEVYSLREFTPKQRTELIEHLISEGNTDKRIGLMIIDGIRDLISDINSPEEATFVSTKLMQWTTIANCHIITVLHQNKGDQNARGHVGTELVNKAETVISVSVLKEDKNTSIVEAEETRDRDFPPFAFTITDSGHPEINNDVDFKDKPNEKKNAFDFYFIEPQRHHEVLKKIFKSGDGYSRQELIAAVKSAWGAYSQQFGDNKAKDIIAYYSQMGWLRNMGAPGKRAEYKYIPDPV